MSWISRARTGAGVSSFLSSPTAVAASVAAVSVAATWAPFNIFKSPLSGESRDIGDARRRSTGSGTSVEKDNSNASAAKVSFTTGNSDEEAQQAFPEQLLMDTYRAVKSLSHQFSDTRVTVCLSRNGTAIRIVSDPESDRYLRFFVGEQGGGEKEAWTETEVLGDIDTESLSGSDSGYTSESGDKQESPSNVDDNDDS